jgi:hypothetical protein
MRISWNLIGVGLGANGGSNTIIKSANTLYKLGMDVTIVDTGTNKNWNEIKCKHLIIEDLKDFPDGDAVIATGFKSVDSTLKLPPRCGKKFHYIRLFENYIFTGDAMTAIMKAPTIKIVNSMCLQRKLMEYNEPSTIIYPGYDFNEIYPLNIRKNNKEVILGGLYNQGKKRSGKRTEWVFETYEYLKSKGYDVKLYMFGTDGTPSRHVDVYIKDPTKEEKNNLFNTVDIWLSTSCLDGLHITPAEAMITKCCVCGNKSDQSGTEDYLINEETGLVAEDNIEDFKRCVERLVNDRDLRIRFGENGRKKILSIGNRETNMKKMADLLTTESQKVEHVKKMKINKISTVLNKLSRNMIDKKPFSLIRIGDGGLKLLHAYYFNDEKQMTDIVQKEGIPLEQWKNVVEMWKYALNSADYIDTCQVYLDGDFWPRVRKNRLPMSEQTQWKINNWKMIYEASGITNTSYINPEINFLSCLEELNRSLIEVLDDKNVCIITAHRKYLQFVLPYSWKVDYCDIVDFGQEHYNSNFTDVCNRIGRDAKNYDVWLVAAGELGRHYSGLIKSNGGRSFDVGSLTNYWAYGEIPVRLQPYMKRSSNELKLALTEEGRKYINSL